MARVLQRSAVNRNARFVAQRSPAGALGKVVFRFVGTVQVVVMDARCLAVRAVLIGIAVCSFVIVPHTGEPVKIVVSIFHLAAVAVLHFAEQAVAVVFVDVRGKRLRAYLHRGLAAQVVVIKGIGDVHGRVAGGVVADRLDAVFLIGVGVLVGLAVRTGLHAGSTLCAVISVTDALPGGVGDAVEFASASVYIARHGIAARVLRRLRKIAVRSIGLFGADVRIGGFRRVVRGHAVVHTAGTGAVPVAVVVVVIDHFLRRPLAQQQVLGLIGSGIAVPLHILVGLDVLPAGLDVAGEVVLAIVFHVRLHAGQVGRGNDVAPVGAAVAVADAELLAVQVQVGKFRVVAVAGVEDDKAQLHKVAGHNQGMARVLPAHPFAVKRAHGVAAPLAAGVLQLDGDAKAALHRVCVGHAVGARPAAAYQHVVLFAADVQFLRKAHILRHVRPAFNLHVIALQRLGEVRVGAGELHAGRLGVQVVAGLRPVRGQGLLAAGGGDVEVSIAQKVDRVGHRAGLQLRAGEPRRAGAGAEVEFRVVGFIHRGVVVKLDGHALPAVRGHAVVERRGRSAKHKVAVYTVRSVGFLRQSDIGRALLNGVFHLDVGREGVLCVRLQGHFLPVLRGRVRSHHLDRRHLFSDLYGVPLPYCNSGIVFCLSYACFW